mmetsp:Transcript_43739/g.74679  ORF Transcript_43739/g.74679 Transcript_43739/m.74679 type:complete len:184 (+) Transcript_43739:1114-1665(+)
MTLSQPLMLRAAFAALALRAVVASLFAALCSGARTAMESTVLAASVATIRHDIVAAVCPAELTAVDPITFAAVSPPSSILSLQPFATPSSQPSSLPWGAMLLQLPGQPSIRSSLRRSAQPSSHLTSRVQGLQHGRRHSPLLSRALGRPRRPRLDHTQGRRSNRRVLFRHSQAQGSPRPSLAQG